MKSRVIFGAGLIALTVAGSAVWIGSRVLHVGDRTDKGILVNTGQWIDPEGKLTLFSARPVDAVLSQNGKRAFLKENEGLTIIDSVTGKVEQRLPIKGGASLTGLALSGDGSKLYFSNADASIVEIDVKASPVAVSRTFKLPAPKVGGSAYACGLAVRGDRLFAALSRSNQVAEINLESGEIIRAIDVDPAPFAVALDGNELWVTSWGTSPKANDLKETSSGTPVAVDIRGIGKGGVASKIDLDSGKATASIPVGSQPCELAIAKDAVYVASANSDVVKAIDRRSGKARSLWTGSVGAAPSSLTLTKAGEVVVACGGANEVVVLDASTGKPKETYRSAWYPIAVRSLEGNLFVASAKGVGSRGNDLKDGDFDDLAEVEKFKEKPSASQFKERSVYQFTGALSIIPRSPTQGSATVALPANLAARKGIKPVPVPERPGEPSVFKHVIYVLKENRTYDQVFGDIPEGDGDPSLCIYGEKVTPNHHALAKEFGLLDNYYCNGVLSADGHSWSTEGNATTYFERSFGGWTRSYPFGDDPLAISATGHIWDSVLEKGLTFRNYGEYDYTEPAKGEKHSAILKDFESGERKIKFKHKIAIDRLRKHSDPDCPGWNMEIPDVLRASYFLRDIKKANTTGKLPAFNFVYLPQDHTSGAGPGVPAPTAHMADNDLALGRIVDAVTKSKFWKDTVIFVIEDDPQAGFDHIDGHRSLCLTISPYSRRQAVVSSFYNQAGVLKTIRHILGLKPVTRFEMEAKLMKECFQAKPNFSTYNVRPNLVPLNLMNPATSTFATLDLKKPDQVDEDEFNRQLWASAMGSKEYPEDWAGAHGRGLASKGLKPDSVDEDDDDD